MRIAEKLKESGVHRGIAFQNFPHHRCGSSSDMESERPIFRVICVLFAAGIGYRPAWVWAFCSKMMDNTVRSRRSRHNHLVGLSHPRNDSAGR